LSIEIEDWLVVPAIRTSGNHDRQSAMTIGNDNPQSPDLNRQSALEKSAAGNRQSAIEGDSRCAT
jgi:hypothetical protein